MRHRNQKPKCCGVTMVIKDGRNYCEVCENKYFDQPVELCIGEPSEHDSTNPNLPVKLGGDMGEGEKQEGENKEGENKEGQGEQEQDSGGKEGDKDDADKDDADKDKGDKDKGDKDDQDKGDEDKDEGDKDDQDNEDEDENEDGGGGGGGEPERWRQNNLNMLGEYIDKLEKENNELKLRIIDYEKNDLLKPLERDLQEPIIIEPLNNTIIKGVDEPILVDRSE